MLGAFGGLFVGSVVDQANRLAIERQKQERRAWEARRALNCPDPMSRFGALLAPQTTDCPGCGAPKFRECKYCGRP